MDNPEELQKMMESVTGQAKAMMAEHMPKAGAGLLWQIVQEEDPLELARTMNEMRAVTVCNLGSHVYRGPGDTHPDYMATFLVGSQR